MCRGGGSVDWLIKSSNQWFFGGGRGEGSRMGLQGKKRVGQGSQRYKLPLFT